MWKLGRIVECPYCLRHQYPGALPLVTIQQLLRSMAAWYSRMACHGNVAKKYLDSLSLSCTVYDLQDHGVCTRHPKTLPSTNCCYNHKAHRECSMSKLRFIVAQLPKDFNTKSTNWHGTSKRRCHLII